ncbi:MAG: hypothetical protein WDZ70_02620 [Candidatus Paceibacterota bacterium]
MLCIARLKGGGLIALAFVLILIPITTSATAADAIDGEPPGTAIVQVMDIGEFNLLMTDNPAQEVAIADIGEFVVKTNLAPAINATIHTVDVTVIEQENVSYIAPTHSTTSELGSTTYDEVLRDDAYQADLVLLMLNDKLLTSNMPPGTLTNAAGTALIEKPTAFTHRLKAKRLADATVDMKVDVMLMLSTAAQPEYYTRL